MLITGDRIRSLGFDWPPSPQVAWACAPADGSTEGAIDLAAVLARLEEDLAYCKSQQDQMYSFASSWDADVDDITDRREEMADKVREYQRAIEHVNKILAALSAGAPPR